MMYAGRNLIALAFDAIFALALSAMTTREKQPTPGYNTIPDEIMSPGIR